MLPVVAHVVAAERQHRHRVAAHDADAARRRGGGLRRHDRADKHAVLPVEGLVNERRGLRAAAAKDNGADGHTLGIVKLGAQAGAVARGRGEAAVGVRSLFRALRRPGTAAPVDGARGRRLVEALPPDGVVAEVKRDVREDRVLMRRDERVGVRLHGCAGRDAEEAVFGVHGPEAAVLADAQPRDIVAHAPHAPAPALQALGRYEHGEVRLAAGGGKCSGDVLDLAARVLDAEDQHVLGHPALLTAKVRGDAQREALLALKHVSAIVRVHRDDRIVLREVDDVLVVLVEVALAVQALDKARIIAERVAHGLADAGHDVHVEHDVNGVGQFKAVFGERRADDGHGVRDDVHGAALIGAVGQSVHSFVHFLGLYPVVRGACILFLFTADERAVLHARHVVGVGAVQVASRELVRVELDEDALLDGLLAQRAELFLFPRDPDNLVRLGDGGHFVDPRQNGLVVRQIRHLFFPS